MRAVVGWWPFLAAAVLVGSPEHSVATPFTGPNLVVNGSFETFNRAINNGGEDGRSFETITKNNDGALPGWSVVDDNIDIWRGPLHGKRDGRQWIGLHGEEVGAVRTSVTTDPGTEYLLQFVAAVGDDGMRVNIGGELHYIGALENGWQEYTFRYVATAATTNITFRSQNLGGNQYRGPTMDFVRFSEILPVTAPSLFAPFAIAAATLARRWLCRA